MPSFATYDDLRQISKRDDASTVLKSAFESYGKTVFLSHSSKDHELVPAVTLILEKHGGRVYVDEHDPGISGADFQKTAERLRSVVRACRKFVLFVTERSKDSKWIPWELGLGDGHNTGHSVALFPAAEKSYEQAWSEQEYLGLYHRIIWGNFKGQTEEWLVLDHRENTAVRLRDWLTR